MGRLEVRIDQGTSSGVHLALLFNGDLISGPCGITIRTGEIAALLARLEPDIIRVDREMINDDVFHRVCGFKNTIFV